MNNPEVYQSLNTQILEKKNEMYLQRKLIFKLKRDLLKSNSELLDTEEHWVDEIKNIEDGGSKDECAKNEAR
jgi:DNA-directed RNA polymerase